MTTNTDLSSLAQPPSPPPKSVADFCDEEITRLSRKIPFLIRQMKAILREKPAGYTQVIVGLEKQLSASQGRRVVLEEIRDMLEKGKLI